MKTIHGPDIAAEIPVAATALGCAMLVGSAVPDGHAIWTALLTAGTTSLAARYLYHRPDMRRTAYRLYYRFVGPSCRVAIRTTQGGSDAAELTYRTRCLTRMDQILEKTALRELENPGLQGDESRQYELTAESDGPNPFFTLLLDGIDVRNAEDLSVSYEVTTPGRTAQVWATPTRVKVHTDDPKVLITTARRQLTCAKPVSKFTKGAPTDRPQ